ncbi:hypothetical protein [Lacunimicrobium album]
MKFSTIAALLCLAFASGCGGATTPDNTIALSVDTSPEASLKRVLADVAKGSEVGSAELMINEELTKLKAKDEAKATAIEGDIKELYMLKGDKMKEKANQIIGKL